MPSLDHSLIQLHVGFLLKRDYQKKFTFASELTLATSPKDSVPDICIYPKKNRVIGNQPDIIKMQDPPLTTIEILSPKQILSDIILKIKNRYFPAGVKSAWVIIPDLRAIVLYQPDKEDYELFKSGALTDPATGITVNVDEVFEVE